MRVSAMAWAWPAIFWRYWAVGTYTYVYAVLESGKPSEDVKI